MRLIKIAQKLRPFSHRLGQRCLIPGSSYVVEAFPTFVRIQEYMGKVVKEIALKIEAPLKNFTLMQNLEKGCVTLFSEQYHFHITPDLDVIYGKHPKKTLLVNQERLSFGSHKKQDWEQIERRRCMQEILPLWFRLGSILNMPARSGDESGLFSLLHMIKNAIEQHKPEEILPHFEKLFCAGFTDMFIPGSRDLKHQGLVAENVSVSDSPLYLLTEASVLIRSLFLVSLDNEISVLPNLPPELHAGRLRFFECPPYGTLNLYWRQKQLRELHFHARLDGKLLFHFPPELKSFRLRHNHQDKGRRLACGDLVEIKSGYHYLLDRFEK